MTSLIRLLHNSKSLSCIPIGSRTCLQDLNNCQHLSKRWAGHSKWQNIRHIKAAKDSQKASVIAQINNKIRIAIQATGVGDPAYNTQLRSAIDEGKSKDVPNASMQNTIKKALSKKSTDVMFEARGPANSCYMINMVTDNFSFTRQELVNAGRKNGIKIGDKGFASGPFTLRGVVYVPKAQPSATEGEPKQEEELEEDRALELAIEAGAEEVEDSLDDSQTPVFQLLCDAGDMWTVKKAVEKLGFAVSEARHEYIPQVFAYLGADQLAHASTFLDRIENSGDAVKVYTNIKDAAAEEEDAARQSGNP